MWSIRNGRRAWSAVFVLLGVLFLLLLPGTAGAQGEESSLLDQLAALQERVAVLEEQLEHQRSVGLTTDERCGIGIFQTLRDETMLGYKNAYGEWPPMGQLRILFVEFSPETETTVIIYDHYFTDRRVMEQWQGCTFLGASDWWEES